MTADDRLNSLMPEDFDKAVNALRAVLALCSDHENAPWTRTTGDGIEVVAVDRAALEAAIEEALR